MGFESPDDQLYCFARFERYDFPNKGTNAWQLVTSLRHYHLNPVCTKVSRLTQIIVGYHRVHLEIAHAQDWRDTQKRHSKGKRELQNVMFLLIKNQLQSF